MGILNVVGGLVALPVAIASDVVKVAAIPVTSEIPESDTKKVVKNIVESTKS